MLGLSRQSGGESPRSQFASLPLTSLASSSVTGHPSLCMTPRNFLMSSLPRVTLEAESLHHNRKVRETFHTDLVPPPVYS
jgi:hypothetical protein